MKSYVERFGGAISQHIGDLTFLRSIDLSNNLLIGEIPSTISHCVSFQYLSVGGNSLVGEISPKFSSLLMLKDLFISRNNLNGPIFSTMLNLASLEELSASYNVFVGVIADTIGQMKNPVLLQLGANLFTGTLPSSIYSLSSINVLFLSFNKLHGKLPTNIASKLPHLLTLLLHVNHFTGSLPISLSNISSLTAIGLSGNKFTGRIGNNSLGTGGANDLNFLNFLSAENLVQLDVANNKLSAEVPITIACLLKFHLTYINLSWDSFEGEVPAEGVLNTSTIFLCRFVEAFSSYIYQDASVPRQISLFSLKLILYCACALTGVAIHIECGYIYMILDGSTFKLEKSVYGLGSNPFTANYIYSYGIAVLGMMTAKRPADYMFKEGLNLQTYMKMVLPDQVVQIVDTRLLDNEAYMLNIIRTPTQAETWMNCVVTMMKIGVACSMKSP
ncbi:hypothetical protein Cgig2_014010 [Carnegiea gigantea]|uniref:Uncharacterized protein n=1 Tax=Carnegiea gigantea TaxID=171969 RepID=A0A9Q1KXA3_9CARY|nr:hypothetical protein Cgig2_014010 [Carnegiea gigantea]